MSDPTPKEIRDLFHDFRNEWQDIRDEAAQDMKAISINGPWTAEDRDARETSGRPCIHLDQINQFLNQTKGNVRKNKRGIQAVPKGSGANDKDARRRSGLIMGIEDKSQAQPIYLHAFECMIERSYGFAVIRTEYRDDSSFDLDIIIKPIMNPDTVLLSPYYKQPNAADVAEAFLIDPVSKDEFKRRWPNAELKDFTDAMMREEHMSDWITQKTVQVAEFRKIQQQKSKLFLIQMAGQAAPEVFSEKQWAAAKQAGAEGEIKRERDVMIPEVFQYMTNGAEILDKVEWDGTRIPIVSCLGPTRYMTEGGKAKKTMLSMVRFARDPQMLFDYIKTQEAEMAGMVPKTPYMGPTGAFETDKQAWDDVGRVPVTHLQYDLIKDEVTGETIPLKPERADISMPFQEYEMAADAASRHIQSSMGISPLPTEAQRRNEKSGVALEKIDDMEQLGAFQFIDRYENGFLHNMGWQINELITPVLDTERQMPITQPDGKRALTTVIGNSSHPIDEQTGAYEVQGVDEDHIHTGKGEFDVTIQTGPSYQSEREAQDEFVDTLIQNLANLPQPQTAQAKVLALGIKMRPTLGPIGQQIADIFDPPQENEFPPEVQAILQQAQQQIAELSQENMALHMDRAGRVLEQSTKMAMKRLEVGARMAEADKDRETKLEVAEITTKAQDASERRGLFIDLIKHLHTHADEFATLMAEQEHEQNLASQQQAHEASQATQQQASDAMQNAQVQ